jgi:hypothetical protein
MHKLWAWDRPGEWDQATSDRSSQGNSIGSSEKNHRLWSESGIR